MSGIGGKTYSFIEAAIGRLAPLESCCLGRYLHRSFIVASALLLIPFVFTRGIFLDGLTYATISRNLAFGLGSYWRPFYTQTVYPEFFEQLPLGLIIQSWLFSAFGDYFFLEKIYSFFSLMLSAFLMSEIWKILQVAIRRDEVFTLSWLPSLLLLTIPKTVWAYKNNILENSMTVFCLMAVYCIIRALGSSGFLKSTLLGLCGALLIVGAMCTKGPAGLFPLAAPSVLFFSHTYPWRRYLYIQVVVTTGCICIAFLFMQVEFIRYFIDRFFQEHLGPAINGARADGSTLSTLLLCLAQNIFPPILLLGLVRRITPRKQSCDYRLLRLGICFFVMGLSASLPLAVSHTFRSFYLVPSLPFFSIAISLVFLSLHAPPRWIKLPKVATYTVMVLLVLFVLVIIFRFGSASRDSQFLDNDKAIVNISRHEFIIGGDEILKDNWRLHGILARYYRLSLETDPQKNATFDYYLQGEENASPLGFESTDESFGPYIILKRSLR